MGRAAVDNRVRQPDAAIGLALKCPDLVIPTLRLLSPISYGAPCGLTTFGQLFGICSQPCGTGPGERRITLRPRIQPVTGPLAGADGAPGQY